MSSGGVLAASSFETETLMVATAATAGKQAVNHETLEQYVTDNNLRGVTALNTGAGLSGGYITQTGRLSLRDAPLTPGAYDYASLTVDQQGRLSAASANPALPFQMHFYTWITFAGRQTIFIGGGTRSASALGRLRQPLLRQCRLTAIGITTRFAPGTGESYTIKVLDDFIETGAELVMTGTSTAASVSGLDVVLPANAKLVIKSEPSAAAANNNQYFSITILLVPDE